MARPSASSSSSSFDVRNITGSALFSRRRRSSSSPSMRGIFISKTARSGGLSISAFNAARSEEHTSELQSLMRISYAVFCLKKKKKTQITKQHDLNNELIANNNILKELT